MRSVTANELAVLLKQERAAHARVKVLRSGTWVNLSDLEGRDWVHEVRVQDGVDAACVQFKATLELAQFFLNLSPFVDASKLNASGALIVLNRPVVIEMAVVPLDVQPQATDWHEVFRGAIDAYKINRATIEIRGRDQGGRLLDTWMETQRVYGTASGVRAELVMQDLLDDYSQDLETLVATYTWNGTTTVTTSDTSEVDVGDYVGLTEAPLFEIASIVPNTSITISNPSNRTIPTGSSATVWIAGESRVTLYAVNGTLSDPLYRNGGTWDDSPDWLVKTFKQGKRRLLTALQEDIARQIGWQVRYRWHSNLAAFALTFYEPDRSKTTPDEEFSDDFIADLSEVGLSIADIRNRVRVTYGTADDRTTTTRNDTSSQDKYGLRAMDIAESSSSLIDTLIEANALGDAALSDLAEPTALAGFVLPLFWPAEVGDLYRWLATSRYFDSDQDLAVSSVVHAVSHKQASRTTVEVRGKPSGGLRRWLELETLPGIAPEADHYADAAASNVAIESNLMGIIVTYDDPRTMDPPIDDWAYTRCHVATSSGFTPSAANLKGSGRQTRFEVAGLVPGQTYYAKLIIIDEAGNVAATSTQVLVATQLVGPYHENPESEKATLTFNPDFNAQTLDPTTHMPDRWAEHYGSYGASADIYYSTSVQLSGGRSLHFRAVATASVGAVSEWFPVTEGDLYKVRARFLSDAVDSDAQIYVMVEFEDINKTAPPLSSFYGTYDIGSVTADVWYDVENYIQVVAPSTARYGRVLVYRTYSGGSVSPNIYVDRAELVRQLDAFQGVSTSGTSVATGTWVQADIEAASPYNGFDYGGNLDLTNDYYVVPRDGLYSFVFAGIFPTSATAYEIMTKLTYQQVGGSETDLVIANGTASATVYARVYAISGPQRFLAGDKIRGYLRHAFGTTQTVGIDFAGQQVQL